MLAHVRINGAAIFLVVCGGGSGAVAVAEFANDLFLLDREYVRERALFFITVCGCVSLACNVCSWR